MPGQGRKITIQTQKARGFRTMAAEGALGGITPSQMYQINFYIEAPNIPSQVTHELTEDGKLGAPVTQTLDGGEILRELQCAIVMTIPQAESLARWILKTIKAQTEALHPAEKVM